LSRRSRENNIFELGSIVGVHGIKGELKLRSSYEVSGELFPKLIIDGRPYSLQAVRFHKDNYLVTLQEISDRTSAEKFFQKKVFVENKPEDFNFAEDILGKKVITLSGKILGTVQEIMNSPLYDVLVVQGEKELLIPKIDQFVKTIAETIIVDMTGLEE
jgi:16S rRNA processing protein RimM